MVTKRVPLESVPTVRLSLHLARHGVGTGKIEDAGWAVFGQEGVAVTAFHVEIESATEGSVTVDDIVEATRVTAVKFAKMFEGLLVDEVHKIEAGNIGKMGL